MTTERDKSALRELETIANLSDDWKERYFLEQQSYVEAEVESSVRNDTKQCDFPKFGRHAFGQMEIWDSETFLKNVDLQALYDGC